MADPSHSAGPIAATAAKGATSGGLTAATLPVDPITMAVGLVAALVALLHMKPAEGEERTPIRVFMLVAASGFLAGAGQDAGGSDIGRSGGTGEAEGRAGVAMTPDVHGSEANILGINAQTVVVGAP